MRFSKGHKINLGRKHTEATKKKIGDIHRGKVVSKETRQKMRSKVMSPETKEKISSARKGKPSNFKGKKMSLASRKKLSQSHKGKQVSEKTRRRMSISSRGSKNPLWEGGITPVSVSIRRSYLYRQWRSDVFTRDEFTCQICSQKGGKLNADHIVPFSTIIRTYLITSVEISEDCPELWNINNGRTLCEECHKKTDTFAGRSKGKLLEVKEIL